MLGRKVSKAYQELVNQVQKELEIYKRARNPKETMKISEYQFWHQKYQELKAEGNKVVEEAKLPAGNYLKELFRTWHDLLKADLVRIFWAPNLYYGRVSSPEEGNDGIVRAILENEAKFKSVVQEAVDYFGEEFLEKELHFDPGHPMSVLNAGNEPVSIRTVLETSVQDWTKLTITSGFPIPYYHSWYNDELPYILDKYIG